MYDIECFEFEIIGNLSGLYLCKDLKVNRRQLFLLNYFLETFDLFESIATVIRKQVNEI